MKFLCLVHFAPDAFAGIAPEEMRRLDNATIEHDHKLRRSGHLLIASPLAEAETEVSLDRRRLKMSLVDGPYAETREQLGGYYLIETPDIDVAIEWAARCPGASKGTVEVRPVWEMRTE